MQYNGICGITKEELHEYFDEGIRKFSKNVDKTPEEIYEKLRENYDGYHFTRKVEKMSIIHSVCSTVCRKSGLVTIGSGQAPLIPYKDDKSGGASTS